MANKFGYSQNQSPERNRRLKELAAQVIARARIVLFTDTDVVPSTTGAAVVVFEKTLSAEFFKSISDSISFVIAATADCGGGETCDFFLRILDEDGSTLVQFLNSQTVGSVSGFTFHAVGEVFLTEEKKLLGSGAVMSNYTTTPVSVVPGVSGAILTAKKLVIQLVAKIDANTDFILKFIKAEFCPAVVVN